MKLEILPYDQKAPEKFESVKQFILDIIPYSIEIKHIGSSSVPHLGGKRVIDVLILSEEENMQKIVSKFELNGYRFNPQVGLGVHPNRFFISGPFDYNSEELHVHYHITLSKSEEHKHYLLFRNYLRKHPEECERYFDLKEHCATQVDKTILYAELKTDYVQEVIQKAKAEKIIPR